MEAIMVAISEINLRSIILLQQMFFKVRIIIRLISFANLPSAIKRCRVCSYSNTNCNLKRARQAECLDFDI